MCLKIRHCCHWTPQTCVKWRISRCCDSHCLTVIVIVLISPPATKLVSPVISAHILFCSYIDCVMLMGIDGTIFTGCFHDLVCSHLLQFAVVCALCVRLFSSIITDIGLWLMRGTVICNLPFARYFDSCVRGVDRALRICREDKCWRERDACRERLVDSRGCRHARRSRRKAIEDTSRISRQ
jgi:hypothetical protein